MSDSPATTYDELPYEGRAFEYAHPSALARTAMLAGLTPAPVERCRVLELGCAEGGHLIPMAEMLPESTFVGVDLSPRQIEAGLAIIKALGLKNVSLQAMSITDVTPSLGEFDYIVCHGVLSWVPPLVQESIFKVCRQNLASGGLAYISYNTYPGFHQRQMAREMLMHHVDHSASLAEQVRQAREIILLMTVAMGSNTARDSSYETSIRDELKTIEKSTDPYVLHEYLETYNEPFYFRDFNKRAEGAGLRYVGMAMPEPKGSRLAWVLDQLPLKMSNAIEREQYIDFAIGQCFRRSVLCRSEQTVQYKMLPEAMEKLWIVKRNREAAVGFSHPVLQAAYSILSRAGMAGIHFQELCRGVQRSVGTAGEMLAEPERLRIANSLLEEYGTGEVSLYAHLDRWVGVTEKPRASAVARYQAKVGSKSIANRRHQMVGPEPLDLFLLPLLDGTRDHTALLAALGEKLDPAPGMKDLNESLERMAEGCLLG